MNRKPIFDAVRKMLGRGFDQDEVEALDLACSLAEAAVDQPEPKPAPVAKPAAEAKPGPEAAANAAVAAVEAVVLGKLSEKFESGGRGPGTVSSGAGDPGGVSYGVYQLSSRAGTLTAFLKSEGKPWAARLAATGKPGTSGFSADWKAIAKADPDFGPAQHKFIERTHYLPAIVATRTAKGLDLDTRATAVREVAWSIAVQHGQATKVLVEGINICDRDHDRASDGFDRALIEALYQARTAYVLGVAENKKNKAEREQLIGITKRRYPEELKDALALLAEILPSPTPAASTPATGDTIDGNVVAAQNGVLVKSASVKISKLHPKMAPVIVAVAGVAKKLSLPQPVITSGNDSNHMNGSLHFKDRALDFRGNNIQVNVGQSFASEVAAALGSEYDVQFETFMNASNNHLHVEYDPD